MIVFFLSRERYFVAPEAECGLDSNVLTPQGAEVDSIDAPCMTPRKRRQNPYENIRRILHERTESTSCDRATGVRRQPIFLRMPESSEVVQEHYITFTEDRRPDHCASDGPPPLYPDTLDAMLQIVSNVRCSTRPASSSSEDLRSHIFKRGGGGGIRRFYVSFNTCYSTKHVTETFIVLT